MNIGESATISRAFGQREIEDIAELCGLVAGKEVPDILIGAMWSTLLGCHLPGPGTLYVQQKTRYFGSAGLGEPVTATVEIVRLQPERYLAELDTRCTDSQGKLLAQGSALVYVRYVTSPDVYR